MREKNEVIGRLIDAHLNSLEKTDNQPIIVDVGCGDGAAVHYLHKKRIEAYGCDIKFKKKVSVYQSPLYKEGYLREIQQEKEFCLPFEDSAADIVYSDQVLEHVDDLGSFFKETARIMKRNGVSFHYFPSSNKVLEPHINVPLATKIQSRAWIAFWTYMPLPNIPREDWSRCGTISMQNYLHENTYYRTGSQILKLARAHFKNVFWDPRTLLDSMKTRKSAQTLRGIPGGPWLFNALWSKLLVCKDPR